MSLPTGKVLIVDRFHLIEDDLRPRMLPETMLWHVPKVRNET